MAPRGLRLTAKPGGALVDAEEEEVEAARAEEEARSRRALHQARASDARVEGADMRRHEEGLREQLRRETPHGMWAP
jgi:hypothetical protein